MELENNVRFIFFFLHGLLFSPSNYMRNVFSVVPDCTFYYKQMSPAIGFKACELERDCKCVRQILLALSLISVVSLTARMSNSLVEKKKRFLIGKCWM